MTPRIQNHRGFTLLEIVVTLILVGILATIAGLGISSGVRGYQFARENSELAQKGQVAMARLIKELTFLSAVSLAEANTLNFTAVRQGGNETHTIGWAAGSTNLLLDGRVLTDHLDPEAGLQLRFSDSPEGTQFDTWTAERRIIEITLRLRGADNTVTVFTARVAPRGLS